MSKKKDGGGDIDGILREYQPTVPTRINRIPLIHRVSPPPIVNEPPKKLSPKGNIEKLANKHSIEELLSTASGLPGRVRSLYRRIDKLIKGGTNHLDILEEIRPIVSKYLAQRMELAVYSVFILRKEMSKHVDPKETTPEEIFAKSKTTPEVLAVYEQIVKITRPLTEADALMMLRAEYFLVGLTARFCAAISGLEQPIHPAMLGLYAIIDLGNDGAMSRQQRIAAATKALHDLGAELPELL